MRKMKTMDGNQAAAHIAYGFKVGDLKYSAVTKGDIKDGDSSTTAIGKLNQKLSGVAAVAGQHSSVSTILRICY